MNSPIKVAIIGVGRWGKNLVKGFSQEAEVLYCLHRNSTETSEWLENNFPKIKIAKDYEEILKDDSVDAVIIATPINTHYELALKAIKSCKHVFIEKPGTEKTKEMKDLTDLANKTGLVLVVGYIFLYHPVLKKLKELINQEKIKFIHFEWLKWGTFLEHPLLNLFSHEISLMLSLGLDPERSGLLVENDVIGNSDISMLTLKNNEIHISAYLNRISKEKRKTVLVKTDKNTYIWEDNQLFVLKDNQKEEVPIEDTNTPLNNEVRDFITCIKENIQPQATGQLATKVLEIIDSLRF